MRSGSCSRMSKAAMHVAATDGGCDVENRNGPRAVVKVINQILRPAHIAAQRADGLGKRAHLHVDLAVHAEVVD